MRKINYFDKAFELISVVDIVIGERESASHDGKYFQFPFFKTPLFRLTMARNDSTLENAFLLFSLKAYFQY